MPWGYLKTILPEWNSFVPHRPLSDLRVGVSHLDEALRWIYPAQKSSTKLLFHPALVFQPGLQLELKGPTQKWVDSRGEILAVRVPVSDDDKLPEQFEKTEIVDWDRLENLWDLIRLFEKHFAFSIQEYLKFHKIPQLHQGVYSANRSYQDVRFDTHQGPVVIESGVEIEPFTYLVGPVWIGKNTRIKAHSRIQSSVIGPECRVSGEISHSVFDAYSNKQHEGFVGHTYIGCWVNLGAGTTVSNLKNNYGMIKMKWGSKDISSQMQFLGAFIADYAKLGIGTKLNGGTKIGLGAQIAVSGYLEKEVPAFAFWTDHKKERQPFDKFIDAAQKMMARRNRPLELEEQVRFQKIYEESL